MFWEHPTLRLPRTSDIDLVDLTLVPNTTHAPDSPMPKILLKKAHIHNLECSGELAAGAAGLHRAVVAHQIGPRVV